MASKAWDDFVNSGQKPTTRQSVLDQINQSIQDYSGALANRSSAGSTRNWDQVNAFSTQMIGAQEKQTQLKYLLNAMGADSGSGGEYSNPFGGGGAGGAGGSGGSGAPTINTSNRFEAGLSDAETRLRSLLDNPDSINQSAAYKFRVGQGQEALQRSLGAKGLLNSGNRLMELTKYGQDMASQEYDAQYGRLGNLLGNYSQSWIGDKNANTGLFNAQANAWNTAQANADRNRYQMGMLDVERNKPVSGGGSSRSSGGGSTAGLYDSTPWNPNTDPTIQRMNRDSGWNYDYSQGGQSLWRNTATGESAWSPGGREGNPTQGQYYNTPAWNRNGG